MILYRRNSKISTKSVFPSIIFVCNRKYSAKDFYSKKTQRRKDAENPSIRQRVSRIGKVLVDKSANAQKTFVGRFILQVSIKL